MSRNSASSDELLPREDFLAKGQAFLRDGQCA
jgi:hypothetical protein